MPFPVYDHCMVKLNDSAFMSIGGLNLTFGSTGKSLQRYKKLFIFKEAFRYKYVDSLKRLQMSIEISSSPICSAIAHVGLRMLREAQLGIQLPVKVYRSQKRLEVAKKATEI
jgi:hypothetical protein